MTKSALFCKLIRNNVKMSERFEMMMGYLSSYQDTCVCCVYIHRNQFCSVCVFVCLQQWTDGLRSLIHNTRANNVCQMTCLRKQ